MLKNVEDLYFSLSWPITLISNCWGVFLSLVSVRLHILQTQARKEYVDTKSRKIGRRPDTSGNDDRFSCFSLLLPNALVLNCWGMHGLQPFHISWRSYFEQLFAAARSSRECHANSVDDECA